MEGARTRNDNQLVLVPQRVGERKFLRAGSKRRTKIRPFHVNLSKINNVTPASTRRKQKADSSVSKTKKKSGRKPRGTALKNLQESDVDSANNESEDADRPSKKTAEATAVTPTSSDRENVSPSHAFKKATPRKSLNEITLSLGRISNLDGSGDLSSRQESSVAIDTESHPTLATCREIELGVRTGSGDMTRSAPPQELSNTLRTLTPLKTLMSSPLATSGRRKSQPRKRVRMSIGDGIVQTGGLGAVRGTERSGEESQNLEGEEEIGGHGTETHRASLNETFTVEDTAIDSHRVHQSRHADGLTGERDTSERKGMPDAGKSRRSRRKHHTDGHALEDLGGECESSGHGRQEPPVQDPAMKARMQWLERTLGGMSPSDLREKSLTVGKNHVRRSSRSVVETASLRNKAQVDASGDETSAAGSIRKSKRREVSRDIGHESEAVDYAEQDHLEDSTEVDRQTHLLSRTDSTRSPGRKYNGVASRASPGRLGQSESEDDAREVETEDNDFCDDVHSLSGEVEQNPVEIPNSISRTLHSRTSRKGSDFNDPRSRFDVERSSRRTSGKTPSMRTEGVELSQRQSRRQEDSSLSQEEGVDSGSLSPVSAQKNISTRTKEVSSTLHRRNKSTGSDNDGHDGEVDQSVNRRMLNKKSDKTSRNHTSRLRQNLSADHEEEDDLAQEDTGPLNKTSKSGRSYSSSKQRRNSKKQSPDVNEGESSEVVGTTEENDLDQEDSIRISITNRRGMGDSSSKNRRSNKQQSLDLNEQEILDLGEDVGTAEKSRQSRSILQNGSSGDHYEEGNDLVEEDSSQMNKTGKTGETRYSSSKQRIGRRKKSTNLNEQESSEFGEAVEHEPSSAGNDNRRQENDSANISTRRETRSRSADGADEGTEGPGVGDETGGNQSLSESAESKKMERLQRQLGGMSPLDRTLDLLSKSRAKLRETMPSLMSPEVLRVRKATSASSSRTSSPTKVQPTGSSAKKKSKGKEIPKKTQKNKKIKNMTDPLKKTPRKLVGRRRGAKKGTWPPKTPRMVLDSDVDTGDASQSAHSIASGSEMEESHVTPVAKKKRTVSDLCDLDVVLECTWEEAQATRSELPSKRLKTIHDSIISNTTGDLLELINLHTQLKNVRSLERTKKAEVAKKRKNLLELQQQQRAISSKLAKRRRQATTEMDSGFDQDFDKFLTSLSQLYKEKRKLSSDSI